MPERLSTVRGQDRPEESGGEEARQAEVAVGRATRRRVERRFEIGLFIRKRVRRHLAFYRQLALAAGRRQADAAQPVTPSPLPPSPPGSEYDSEYPPTKKAFAVRSEQSSGTGDDDPTVSPQAAMPDDDAGPIESTSFEIGAFASSTTETTTDGT